MTLRAPFVINALDSTAASKVDQNFQRAYANKLEARHKRVASGVESYVFVSSEFGEMTFSATGSPTVAKTFALKEKRADILFAIAHAKSVSVSAHVTDVTQTAITIECRLISGTANFSGVTTAAISVYYQVIGSDS